MNSARIRWTVRLTDAAENDFRAIILWSFERFGERQARIYGETLAAALEYLAAGPSQAGIRARDDIAKDILTLRVARNRRKGRHFAMFRIAGGGERVIEVLRLLHDSMAPQLHLPPSAGGSL